MPYASLRDFIARLEAAGRLVRAKAPVSPRLEITEIHTRLLAERGPAVLFEQVLRPEGGTYDMPVLTNLFGTVERVAWGMDREPGQLREVGETLAGVRVSDVMSTEPQTVPADIPVAKFIDRYLFGYRHTAYPLVEDGHPVGLVSLDRVRQVRPDQRERTALREVACGPDDLTITNPQEPLTELLPRLNQCADGRALVVVDGRLIGMVSPSDVSRAMLRGSRDGADARGDGTGFGGDGMKEAR